MKRIDAEKAREMMEENLPEHLRNQIVPIIFRAYSLVREFAGSNGWEDSNLLKELHGYLVHYAVQFELIKSIKDGRLDIKHKVSANAKRNNFHLELITPKFTITQNQVNFKDALPRAARYRENLCFVNDQWFLEIDIDQENKFYIREKPYHMLITHGYNNDKPKFITIGIPDSDGKEWITSVDALDDFKKTGSSHQHKVEEITEQHIIEFKTVLKDGHL